MGRTSIDNLRPRVKVYWSLEHYKRWENVIMCADVVLVEMAVFA